MFRPLGYAHDGEVWQFATPTSVPKPLQKRTPPMWIAARDISSHEFAVANGCNVMVTPLMEGDEEVEDLARKFDTAVGNNPGVPRPDLMVLRHTHVHARMSPTDGGVRPRAFRSSTARLMPGSETNPRPRMVSSSPALQRSSPTARSLRQSPSIKRR